MGESAVFLQVRLTSSRLPGKALLPLAGKPVIVHVMEAMRAVDTDQHWLVTDEGSAPRLERLAGECGYSLYAGDPENVLRRFCDAAQHAAVDTIVRVTGDNPLTSRDLSERSLRLMRDSGADYAGITGTPLGTGVEVLRTSALQDLLSRTTDRYEIEHVSPGLYRNPHRYRVVTRHAEESLYFPSLRVTLDTEEDYDFLQELFKQLYTGKPIELPELIAYGRYKLRNSA